MQDLLRRDGNRRKGREIDEQIEAHKRECGDDEEAKRKAEEEAAAKAKEAEEQAKREQEEREARELEEAAQRHREMQMLRFRAERVRLEQNM